MNPKSRSISRAEQFCPARDAAADHRRPACEGRRASGLPCACRAIKMQTGGTPVCRDRRDACLPVALAALCIFSLSGSPVLAGSLWREGVTDERGMFADKRAKRVGDILTIIVQETASVSNSEALKTAKSSKSGATNLADAIVQQFVSKIPGKNSAKVIDPKSLNLSSTGTNDYTGGGEVKNSQTIATRAAVQVIDVLPNGNLVVEGLREISFSKERQFASLRGLVRAYDILPDNTVLSSNMADARIEIISEGTLTDAQKKGWLLRLNDKINPF